MRVGCIGLGTMGSRMAARLIAAGHELYVFDPVVPGLAGATTMASAAAVAAESEILFSSVPGPPEARTVYLGPSGVKAGARTGRRLVCADLSTIDPATARAIGAELAHVGVEFLDAPVSGGASGAAEGTLSVMVGGQATALEQVRPVLELLAGRIVHLGPVGAGTIVKLANQLLVGTTTLAIMEAMTLGAEAGIDLDLMFAALSGGVADSFLLRRNVTQFLRPRQFEASFAMRLLVKDLRLCAAEADRLGLDLATVRLARDTYERGLAAGLADQDFAAIVTLIEPTERPHKEGAGAP